MRATSVELTPDSVLITSARTGDMHAFAQLWERHQGAAVRFAGRLVRPSEAEDLASEAFTNIFQTLRNGAGPDEMFRPYLYVTLKNLAVRWSVREAAARVDDDYDLDQLVDPVSIEDAAIEAFDRSLVATAFRSLPSRWQEVLWYTEVEGLKAHEVGPILGMSANGVAALAYRARDGFRRLWVEQQNRDDAIPRECRQAGRELESTDELSSQAAAHIAGCRRCSTIAAQGDNVSTRLRAVLVPLLLGGAAGGTLLDLLAREGAAQAVAAALAAPSVPGAITGTAPILAVAHVPHVVAATLAIATATTLGFASFTSQPPQPAWSASAVEQSESSATSVTPSEEAGSHEPSPDDPPTPAPTSTPAPAPTPPSDASRGVPATPPASPPAVPPASPPAVPPVDASAPAAPVVATTFAPGASGPPALSGTGEPGAVLRVVADGVQVAEVPVDDSGNWSTDVLPIGPYTSVIAVSQSDLAGNASPVQAIAPQFEMALHCDGSYSENSIIEIIGQGWIGARYSVYLDGVFLSYGTVASSGTTTVFAGLVDPGVHNLMVGYTHPFTSRPVQLAHCTLEVAS